MSKQTDPSQRLQKEKGPTDSRPESAAIDWDADNIVMFFGHGSVRCVPPTPPQAPPAPAAAKAKTHKRQKGGA